MSLALLYLKGRAGVKGQKMNFIYFVFVLYRVEYIFSMYVGLDIIIFSNSPLSVRGSQAIFRGFCLVGMNRMELGRGSSAGVVWSSFYFGYLVPWFL